MMRKVVKLLHTIASCGLIGALLGYMVVLIYAPQSTPQAYADMRQTISALCNYILVPSLGVALVSGLVSMMVHRPFQELRWVWVKALLGFTMFEGTLAVIQGKARSAAEEAAKIATGTSEPGAMASIIGNEWLSLCFILALCLAQIVLGVWRPRLSRTG